MSSVKPEYFVVQRLKHSEPQFWPWYMGVKLGFSHYLQNIGRDLRKYGAKGNVWADEGGGKRRLQKIA
jgi:hypothetical protein